MIFAATISENRTAFAVSPREMPVFGTIAARFNDDGLTRLVLGNSVAVSGLGIVPAEQHKIIAEKNVLYLAEIAETVRDYKSEQLLVSSYLPIFQEQKSVGLGGLPHNNGGWVKS